MTRVLILGANGQVARNTTAFFLERTDSDLTLYLRRAKRLVNPIRRAQQSLRAMFSIAQP